VHLHSILARPFVRIALILLATLLCACSDRVGDPVSSAVAIAEARCDCTRQKAPEVAPCVNHAAEGLERITTTVDEGATRSALVRAYEAAFRNCPWDDPSYYR